MYNKIEFDKEKMYSLSAVQPLSENPFYFF